MKKNNTFLYTVKDHLVSEDYFNLFWDKQKKINPIKRGDKDYNQKNSEINQFKENIDKIERDILREGEIPYPLSPERILP